MPLFLFSIGLKNHTRIKFNSTVHFYDVGIGGRDEEKGQNAKRPNWMLRKFTTLYKALDPPVNGIQVSNRIGRQMAFKNQLKKPTAERGRFCFMFCHPFKRFCHTPPKNNKHCLDLIHSIM